MAPRILVVAGGVAAPAEVRAAAHDADFVIAVDHGFSLAQTAGIHVDLLMGDLDSLASAPSGVLIVRVPEEKDATDLELALDHAASLSPERIVVVGAFGARLDHTLANANLLEKYDVPIVLWHGQVRAYLVTQCVEISAQPGDLVSLIPLSAEAKGIDTQGLRYALAEGSLRRASTRGVSNEVVGLPCRVEVRQGKLLLIHIPKGGGQACGSF